MKRYKVRFTPEAEEDLTRLYDFLARKDLAAAEQALEAIDAAIDVLATSPFSCRKAAVDTPLLRELIIAFGASGYVALFEIDGESSVTIIAVRHQREDDYF